MNNKVYTVLRKDNKKALDYEDIENAIEDAKKNLIESDTNIVSLYDSISIMKRIIDENSCMPDQMSNARILYKKLDNNKDNILNTISSNEIDTILDNAMTELGNINSSNCKLSTNTERTIGIILNSKNISSKQLSNGRNILFRANKRIAYAYANSMFKRRSSLYKNFELDDFIQAGMEGLWIAICKYNGMNRISSYAVWWIRQHIQRMIPNDIPKNKIENKLFDNEKLLSIAVPDQLPDYNNDEELSQYIEQSDYIYSTNQQSSKSVDEQVFDDDISHRMNSCINSMPKIEQAVARNIAAGGNMQNILDKFNITPRQYRLTYARAVSDLRKALGENNINI